MIDILKDLFCPHHYTLLSYAKRLAYTRPGSIYTDFSTYDVYKDIPELAKVWEKYDCWEVLS